MGRFMVLRMYARKIAKVQQGKLLKQLHDDGEIIDLVFGWSKKGICAALTANWLKKEQRYRDGPSDKLLQKALGDFYTYKQTSRGQLFDEVGLSTKPDVLLPNLPPGRALKDHIGAWMRNDTRADRAAYISYDVSGRVSGGHGVGARQHRDHLHFFDPNCGWYELTPGKEADFFRVYEIAYKDLGLTISGPQIVPVK
jgi:hypothetical protein